MSMATAAFIGMGAVFLWGLAAFGIAMRKKSPARITGTFSDNDWDAFSRLIDNPPEPTRALREAYRAYKERFDSGQDDGETMALKFVVCVNEEDLGADVSVGHVYEAIGDQDQHGMIRIIDRSGEDYLYPANCFEAFTLSDDAERRLRDALAFRSTNG
jgi:hypothetical protein